MRIIESLYSDYYSWALATSCITIAIRRRKKGSMDVQVGSRTSSAFSDLNKPGSDIDNVIISIIIFFIAVEVNNGIATVFLKRAQSWARVANLKQLL